MYSITYLTLAFIFVFAPLSLTVLFARAIYKHTAKELIDYIECIEKQPFKNWSEDSQRGYLTACISIKQKLKALFKYH